MTEYMEKEVYFDVYCQYCVYKPIDETDADEKKWYTCSECLDHPSQTYSHKPLNFKKQSDVEKTDILAKQEELHG